MDPEITRQLAVALARDVAQDPRLSAALTYLVKDVPASEGAVEFFNAIKRDLVNEFEDSTLPAKFPRTRALVRSLLTQHSGLGQDWGAVIGGLVDAATRIWVAREQIEAQKDIAELQAALKTREAEAAKAASEARAKEAEAAIKTASLPGIISTQPGTMPSPAVPIAETGLPSWALPVGIGVGVLVLVLAFSR